MKTNIVFRRWNDSKEVIAIFPDSPWGLFNDLTSYMHIGQHGGCSREALEETTQCYNEPDVIALQKELESIGYNLNIQYL